MTYDEAVAACRRAIGLSPDDKTPLNRLSHLARSYFGAHPSAEASVYGLMFENLVNYVEHARLTPPEGRRIAGRQRQADADFVYGLATRAKSTIAHDAHIYAADLLSKNTLVGDERPPQDSSS